MSDRDAPPPAADVPASRGYRLQAIAIVVLCIVLFAASLIPAGFAIFIFDTPGSGLSHTVNVWGRFLLLALMPVFSLAAAISIWRASRRGKTRRVGMWSFAVLVLAVLWATQAWLIYFT